MKIEKFSGLVAVFLACCLAAVAQTPTASVTPTAPAPTAPAPSTTTPPVPSGPAGPVNALVSPAEPSVVAHGTEPEPQSNVEVIGVTNIPGSDEVLDLVQFDALPLPDAVRSLALQAGLNIEFDPRLTTTIGADGHPVAVSPPTVTEKWKKVTAKEALATLLDNYGWQLTIKPGSTIARVTLKNPAALEPLVTAVVQLQYSTPSNIVTEIQPTLSQRSSIVSDGRTHMLILRTTAGELPAAEALITKLDSATRQVLIEAKIIETTKDITSAKGVDWTGTLAAQHVSFGNGLTTAGTSYGNTLTSPSSNLLSPFSSATTIASGYTNVISGATSTGGGLSLNTAHGFNPSTAFLNADGVQAVLSFLNTDADTKQISFPRTVALDGVATELMVVQNVPIFEQQQSAPAAGASQGLATVLPNYDKTVNGTILNEVGVKLTVLPRIAGPTNVMMDLRPEISAVDPQVATDTLNGQVNTAPIFDRRSIVTQAAVPSTYTLVLGGLEADKDQKNYTKVPFLGDIPGLGYAFRSDSKSRTADNILIFVTPTIIQDTDFQLNESRFLKSKSSSISGADLPPWDTGKPYDWTKPKADVTPAYEP